MQPAKWFKCFTNSNFRSKIVLIRFPHPIFVAPWSLSWIKSNSLHAKRHPDPAHVFWSDAPLLSVPKSISSGPLLLTAGTQNEWARENYLCIRCFAWCALHSAMHHSRQFVLIFYASDLLGTGEEHINLTQDHFNFGLRATGNRDGWQLLNITKWKLIIPKNLLECPASHDDIHGRAVLGRR